MKRSLKIGLTLMALGAVLFGVGWMNHGDKAVVWNKSTRGFKTIQEVKRSYHPGDYQRIVVDSKAPVTIKAGDTNRVTVSYMDGDASLPKASVAKGTLTIKGGSSARHLNVSIFSLSDRSTTNGGVLITVPRDKKLDSIVVKKGSGSLSLRQLQAKQVAIENTDDVNLYALRVDRNVTVYSTDGDIYADHVRAQQLRVNADDGDMGISNSQLTATDNQFISTDGDVRLSTSRLGGGRIDSNDGDVNLQGNRITQKLKVSTNDGDIHANIAKSAGAKVFSQDADMSDITVLGKHRHNGYWLRREAKSQYQLTAGDGNVQVSDETD